MISWIKPIFGNKTGDKLNATNVQKITDILEMVTDKTKRVGTLDADSISTAGVYVESPGVNHADNAQPGTFLSIAGTRDECIAKGCPYANPYNNPQYWNIITWGALGRRTQIAIQAYQDQGDVQTVWIRRKHDASWSDWSYDWNNQNDNLLMRSRADENALPDNSSLDSVNKGGIYYGDATRTYNSTPYGNGVTGKTFLLMVEKYNDAVHTQRWYDVGASKLFERRNFGGWGGWAQVWTSLTDGSNSGLDSDLWDSKHRPLNFGEVQLSVPVLSSNFLTDLTTVGSSNYYNNTAPNLPTAEFYTVVLLATGDAGARNIYLATRWDGSVMYIGGGSAGAGITWSNIWTNSIDGANSGLDADLLDGRQHWEFMHNGGLVTGGDLDNYLQAGCYRFAIGPFDHSPNANDFMLLVIGNTQDPNYRTQIATSANGYIEYRWKAGGGWSPWQKIWTAVNDGNLGQPPSPKDTTTGNVPGRIHISEYASAGAGVQTPFPDGTWRWSISEYGKSLSGGSTYGIVAGSGSAFATTDQINTRIKFKKVG